MTQYKGYYIDHRFFSSKEEIDRFLEEQAVNSYRIAVELFALNRNMEYSSYCEERAAVLVDNFGYTWEQVEALEIAVLEAIA